MVNGGLRPECSRQKAPALSICIDCERNTARPGELLSTENRHGDSFVASGYMTLKTHKKQIAQMYFRHTAAAAVPNF